MQRGVRMTEGSGDKKRGRYNAGKENRVGIRSGGSFGEEY
jgi:hypothetical protein